MWVCLHSSGPGSDQVWLIKKVNGKQVYCWHKKVTVSGMSCVLQGYSLYPTSFILLSTISSYLLPPLLSLFCSSLHLHCCSSLCSSLHLLLPLVSFLPLVCSFPLSAVWRTKREKEVTRVRKCVCVCVCVLVCVCCRDETSVLRLRVSHKFLGITLKVDLDSKLKRLDFDSHYFDQTWLKLTNLP